ncbi:AAA family ATPase [uncultured Serinicoccus sp.]|uniref:AAA family ATPase n=1 Tax=uncultured Serinicoccus sp. TaxID=735514 RepID=UPI002626592D|nr:AAA family ATPase [uncultured Serinicoccus sp.]
MGEQLAVAVTGAPGAGKTSTGQELARVLGAALLDLDTVTNPLVDLLLASLGGQGYDDPQVAPQVRRARYACLVGAAQDCLRTGTPVVLVAPFTAERADPGVWAVLARTLTEAGGDPWLAWLEISAGELGERLRARGAQRDHAKLADLDGYLAGVDLAPPAAPHLAVDATLPPPEQARHLHQQLVKAPR